MKEAAAIRWPSIACSVSPFARGYTLMFMGAAASSMTWSGEQIPPLFYVVSTASPAPCSSGARWPASASVRFMTIQPRLRGTALTTGGTSFASSAVGPERPSPFGILGAITTGIGSGLIDLGYGELYRNEPPPAPRSSALALLLAAVAFSLVIMLLAAVGCLICSLLPPFPAGSCSSSSMPGRASTKPASCPSIST